MLEDIVTNLMTPAVIDLLEMVQVEKYCAEWMAVTNAYRERRPGERKEMAAVVDTGQLIGARVLLFARGRRNNDNA